MDATPRRCTYVLLMLLLLNALIASRGQAQDKHLDLTQMSLEDLMNVTVTSASKKKERLSDVTAAMYVLTQEDLYRSGATSIPEALRMVPGMQVARIDGNKWAISARGFNGSFANKLLVLVDGRSVYTPLFSGVFWDVQDLRLEDIDRIEVIRGPGATLWGANAVNGVINIITRSAKENQGGAFATGMGSEEHRFGNLHYGGTVDSTLSIRAYGKSFTRNSETTFPANRGRDNWTMSRGGFRMDWEPRHDHSLTLQGDIYTGDLDQTLILPSLLPPYSSIASDRARAEGGNVLARWDFTLAPHSDLSAQVYFDKTRRSDVLHTESRNTFDFEIQHGFRAGSSHDVIWGIGYRTASDDLTNSATVIFSPTFHRNHLVNAFVQDNITLIDHELILTVGSKVERNSYSIFEVQPNARLLWKVHDRHTLWGAASRAARTPSRAERDVLIHLRAFPTLTPFGTTTTVVTVAGNDTFKSEKLTAYELGYRYQPFDRVSVDFAGFFNSYRDLRTVEPLGPPTLVQAQPAPYLAVPMGFDNKMDGDTYGVELGSTWQISDAWKMHANYTWFHSRLSTLSSSLDPTAALAVGDDPSHKVHIRSYLTLFDQVEVDFAAYYVGRLQNQDIPAYVRFDGRIGWHINKHFLLTFVGHNLFHERHTEFGNSPLGAVATTIQRSVYGKIEVRL